MEARENKTDELFSSVSPHLSLMSLVSPLLSTLFLIFLFLMYPVSPFSPLLSSFHTNLLLRPRQTPKMSVP